MLFNISIPTPGEPHTFSIEPGSSTILVGANGAGKTRLAVYLEEKYEEDAHRISAQRSLSLNPSVAKISEESALTSLRYGTNNPNAIVNHRASRRWNNKPATRLLSDFDPLVQALFANQSNIALTTHNQAHSGHLSELRCTKLQILKGIWERLLPERQLLLSGDDIQVSSDTGDETYSASDMSDGERAIFYLLGQALTAKDNSLLIIDEPELHVHRSIISSLWDEIEAARPDCAFVFITHDLDFASSKACPKFVISKYSPTPSWEIEEVGDNGEFSENLTTLILGSRKPILFVEGGETSLDLAVYRCCYPEWTIVPRGSCENVIHAVSTMRHNSNLTRIFCTGIVDADDYTDTERSHLQTLGISVLPVSEIENIFLLPSISAAIAKSNNFEGAELQEKLDELSTRVFSSLDDDAKIDAVVIRYCKRRIDRQLKKVDIGPVTSVDDVISNFNQKISEFDIQGIAEYAKGKIRSSIDDNDISALMEIYDGKGALMNIAATCLKQQKKQDFESWITRSLRKNEESELVDAITSLLPQLEMECPVET